ncbi:DUF58 domain-containing protein [Rhodobium gokarnense]|uniref:Uncharacterized protein (DUF58 family) n=1 Tax=Rhodobium gokarnense TaxID=364296 RepID=A0ABT3H5N4_9HYPH|nr:DUF58 domain-containing protein [Rhodobium gokarnense]MCW2305710.1 uncharacterized protein (DUF58 family) [Rhodobium gokarnense]
MATKKPTKTETDAPIDAHWPAILRDSRTVASSLPDLLVEARRIAVTVAAGWHGRRQPGPGETFWQFRPFVPGEPANRVDWRRSARDDHLYVRELEWEAAHTVWLWADLSPSMAFRSNLAPVSKRDRALVLLLALSDLLAASGERIGLLDLTRPTASRGAAEHIASTLSHFAEPIALPRTAAVKRFSDVVLFADLLDPIDVLEDWVRKLAANGARGHLVQILDPVEETFPFAGRTEFLDPESGLRVVAGRAETWRQAYIDRLAARRERLARIVDPLGWTLIIHHTDRPAAEPLLALHHRLTESDHGHVVLMNRSDTAEAAR